MGEREQTKYSREGDSGTVVVNKPDVLHPNSSPAPAGLSGLVWSGLVVGKGGWQGMWVDRAPCPSKRASHIGQWQQPSRPLDIFASSISEHCSSVKFIEIHRNSSLIICPLFAGFVYLR